MRREPRAPEASRHLIGPCLTALLIASLMVPGAPFSPQPAFTLGDTSPKELLLIQARKYWKQKRYPDAATSAQEVLKLELKGEMREEATFIAGTSYYHVGDFQRASEYAKDLIAAGKESQYWDDGVLLMARVLSRTDHDLKSAEYLFTLLRSAPESDLRGNAREWLEWLIREKLTSLELAYVELAYPDSEFDCLLKEVRLGKMLQEHETAEAVMKASEIEKKCVVSKELRVLVDQAAGYGTSVVSSLTGGANVFRIGLLCPLNGEASAYGEAMAHGAQLAVDDQNGSGDLKFTLVVRDTEGDPIKAAVAAKQLIADAHVGSLIGDAFSSTTIAAAARADALKIPILSPSAPLDRIGLIGDYVFVATVNKTLEGLTIADYVIRELGLKTFVVFACDTQQARDFVEAFCSEVAILGGQILQKTYFPEGKTDFTQELESLKEVEFDGVVVDGGYRELLSLLPQIRFFEIEAAVISSSNLSAERIRKEVGPFAEKAICAASYYWLRPEEIDAVRERFEKAFGREFDSTSLRTYLAAKLIMSTVTEGAYTPELLRQGLTGALYPWQTLGGEKVLDFHRVGGTVPILSVESGELVGFK